MSRKPIHSWCAVVLVALAVLAATGCSSRVEGAGTAEQQRALPVKTQIARLEQVGEFTDYLATIKSRSASLIQPQVEGYITRIHVRAGDAVEEGTPLVDVDSRKQQATVNSQEASRRSRMATLEYNRLELERRKQLFAEGVISKQELDRAATAYDQARADVQALEASVREQRVQLRYFTVRAPKAGVIGDIPVRVGDRVTTETVLTTLDSGNDLEAYISVPAERASEVRMNAPVEILDDNGKPRLRTEISFISPRLDTQNQLLLVKARIKDGKHGLRNDELVRARIIWRQTERPLIPVTAVARLSGQAFAFVAEGDDKKAVARQRPVRLGDVMGNDYIVLEGVKAGDKVITTGVQMLVDGMPVAPGS